MLNIQLKRYALSAMRFAEKVCRPINTGPLIRKKVATIAGEDSKSSRG